MTRDEKIIRNKVGVLEQLYWRAGLPQPGFCAGVWRHLRATRHLARDRALFDRTLADGDRALAAGNVDDLRHAIFMTWENRLATGVHEHVGERAWLMRS